MRYLILLITPLLFGFDLPRGSYVDTVADKYIHNGLQMEVLYFKHKDSPEEFASDLLVMLENEPGEVVTSHLSKNVLSIGLVSEKKYTSVTVQSDRSGGTEGFQTTTNKKQHKIPDPPLDISHSFNLLSYTADHVGLTKKETWVFHSKRDLVWVRNQIKQHNLDEMYRGVNGSTFYQGVVGTSRLQITASEFENGTGLVIVK